MQMNNMTRKTVAYVMLPAIWPRLKALFASGFSYVSYFMALVLNMIRLLPDNHPYLNAMNFGRFGLHHVLWQAWKNLEFKRQNIDQIIIFFTLLAGVVILFLQIIMFALALAMPVAQAGIGDEFARFFVTQNPEDDLAFMFLDRVFGMEGIFESRVTTEASWPTNFHAGLHEMFGYYNTGLAIVAFLLIIYFAITLTAETAQTGVPFGRRFNGAMAPLRLIIALALLAPLTSGMNGAQLITLYVSKWGSSLATNGWQLFLDEAKTASILGDAETLVVTPKPPQANVLVEFMFVAVTCRYAYELTTAENPDPTDRYEIRPYVILGPETADVLGQGAATSLNSILGANGNRNVSIRIGHRNEEWYNEYAGYVKPLCGEIEFNLQDINEAGAYYVQNAYIFNLIQGLWDDGPNNDYAENMVRRRLSGVNPRDPTLPEPQEPFIQDTFDYFNDQTLNDIEQGVLEQIAGGDWEEDFSKYGWGGAAIWYNKIAQYNGSLISSVYNLPVPKKYPMVMEEVHNRKRAQNNNVEGAQRFRPVLADSTPVYQTSFEQELSELLYDAQQVWQQTQSGNSGNYFVDGINMVMGLQGLINIRDNVDIHPLAQLVGVGRSLIEAAVQNFGYTIGGFFGGLVTKGPLQKVMQNATSFFSMIAMMTFSIGFVLYFVLPFLPFLYFFIALTNWVKTIFEAMVGLPLWALAHIRIDGVGLPGPAGMNGYYLIFEIFISPVLIVLGMLAGITIFSAQVQVLNEIWGLVISNHTGHDPLTVDKTVEDKVGSIRYLRGALDKFFYTAMYAVLVYMMGMASFKLVDRIPNGILRWLGTGVKSFGEGADGMADQLMGQSYASSQKVAGNMDQVANMSLLSK